VDAQLYEGRSLDIVTQVESLGAYGEPLVADYRAYTAGTAMLETAERFTEEREPALQQFLLLVGGLRALAAGERDPSLLLDSFLLRSLAVAGYAPSFDACARCGLAGPHRSVAVALGGAVCGLCRPPGAVTPSPATFALLSSLLTGTWAIADASEPGSRREASGIVAAYLHWHLERGLRSLPHVVRG
jgi:DNA repair protein RecO (recombination protein O)